MQRTESNGTLCDLGAVKRPSAVALAGSEVCNGETLPPTPELPKGMGDLIMDALSVDPKKRPSPEEFESRLWEALRQYDPETHQGLKIQVESIEELSSDDTEWPHMDDRLMQLRTFYSLRPIHSDD